MKKFLLFFICLTSIPSFGQINEDLTPEERAYLFHVVKKSPILNNNFGRFFDYQGPEILLSNKSLNYDSIELLIINQPDLLIVRKEEIAKSSKGLIAEAANKMAVWELNNVLSAKRDEPDDLKQYKNEYAYFESLLMASLPPNATKIKNDVNQPHPKMHVIMNPNMTLDDKAMQLASLKFLTTNDQIVTLNAINDAINQYVEKRAFEIFRALGGRATSFKNILVAAGDGSNTEGLLEEREKDERGRWNRGLPKAVGLFPYQLFIEKTEEKKRVTEKIEPLRITTNNFKTPGKNKFTNLHFDVWGYNSEKQTTVVIEKNGLNYHLFGSKDTRFLSPDSTFSAGTTFQSIIDDLEFNKIAKINELIYGKKGFDYWIDYNEKKRDATELKIEKREKEYSDLGFSPITTSSKASSKVKKSKRKAIKNGAFEFDGTPTTNSNRKEKKDLQSTIVGLYNLYEAYKKKIADLKKEKAEAVDLMAIYQRKLDIYKQAMGIRWATFTEENGLYTFEDSTTFDIITQEFKFKPSAESEDFEVRLIAIPESCLSRLADEVMLHINVMDAEPNYDARINLELMDVFESDKWELPGSLFKDKDSIALRIFFEGMLDKKIPFEIIARGQGVGSWNGVQTVKDYSAKELSRYPGNNGKMDSSFVRLRKSEVLIHIDRAITMEVNSFTDPVSSSLSISNEEILSVMSKYKLSKNDILSAYRTATILKTLKTEINVLAGKYLNREEAKIVIDRFNKQWLKTRINVGRALFKVEDF